MRLLVLLLALGGCAYLVPHHHQTTELSALPEGPYRLDPEHATILFKIDHLGLQRRRQQPHDRRLHAGFAARGSVLRSTFGLGAFAPAIADQVLRDPRRIPA